MLKSAPAQLIEYKYLTRKKNAFFLLTKTWHVTCWNERGKKKEVRIKYRVTVDMDAFKRRPTAEQSRVSVRMHV